MVTNISFVPSFNFSGLRIVGDVHGESEAFAAVIGEARVRKLFVVQLGDLVDRGPDSAGALAAALDLVAGGEGVFLRSNHDDKLRRALAGNSVRIGAELARTLASLDAVPGADTFRARVAAGLAAAPWL